MNKLRKILSVIIALIMCISSMGVNAFAETSVQLNDITWTMASHSAVTGLNSDFEWNGLRIAATTEKAVSFDGTYLKLAGGANKIYFKVAGPCTITVSAKNNSTSVERFAVMADSNGAEIGTKVSLPVSGSVVSGSFKYTGYGEELSLYPSGGGINIKSISVVYDTKNNKKGDVNGDGNVNEIDAAAVLRHISGISLITDTAMLSAANGNNDGSIDIMDANWILNNRYEITTESTTVETIDTSDGVEVKSYNELVAALSTANAKAYVMNDIEMGDMLQLTKGGQSIIGVPDETGVLPILDFENMTGKNDIVNSSSSDSDVGLRIRSSNNVIKNIVIEKAHDNGIQIKGAGVTGNLVENCIVRYNNDSGIQVTGGACGNTLKGVYSYRNCDVYTLGGNADGFAIKLSAGPETTTDTSVMDAYKNVCIDCYAWENGDDGWDSFDYPAEQQNFGGVNRWTYRNDYTNCMCWSNGTPANCLGYNDYKNGLALDENLPFIRRFKTVNPSVYDDFVAKYNNGTLCSRTASASTYYSKLDSIFGAIPTTRGELKASEIAADNWQGNPNGFKLGSKYTQSNSLRYMYNCISFDHDGSGFDKNNSGANLWADNCISFNNNINYHLSSYTAKSWTNVFGWNGSSSDDLPSNGGTPSSSGSSQMEEEVRAAADRIVGYANANKVVASSVFGSVF